MEKETTGLYLSGHPMDDYRPYLKNTHVLPIGSLMEEGRQVEDESIVSVAGIIQKVRLKTTRNNSMMAYVTLEDDTASMELFDIFQRIKSMRQPDSRGEGCGGFRPVVHSG